MCLNILRLPKDIGSMVREYLPANWVICWQNGKYSSTIDQWYPGIDLCFEHY